MIVFLLNKDNEMVDADRVYFWVGVELMFDAVGIILFVYFLGRLFGG